MSELEAKVFNIVDAIAEGTRRSSPALGQTLRDLEAALASAKAAAVPIGATRILPAALDRYRRLVRELPETAARDPMQGREALREVLGGASIILRPTGDGGVEAVVPLPSLSKLLNSNGNMSIGSGGRIRHLLARLPRRPLTTKNPIAAALAAWGPRSNSADSK